MPLIKEYVPATGRFNYRQDPPDPNKPVVLTGPVNKPIQVADGTVYDPSEDYVEVASVAHAGELSHQIGLQHERDGHPNHLSRFAEGYDPLRDEFHHTCDDGCGELKRSPEQQEADFADRLRRLGHGALVDDPEQRSRDADDAATYGQTLQRLAAMRATANQES